MAPRTSASSTVVDHPDDPGAEQSPDLEDHAAETSSDVETGEQAPSTDQDEGTSGATDDAAAHDDNSDLPELISNERFEALKSNPDALRKEMNRGLTKGFQKLAGMRKDIEPLRDLIAAFREDPKTTLKSLAPQYGLEIRDAGDTGKPAAPQTPEPDLTTQILEATKASLGAEYEDLAEKLAPAIQWAAELVAGVKTQPLQKRTDELLSQQVQREADLTLSTFAKSHPDFKKYEPRMTELMGKFPPSAQVDETEYLEGLYLMASRDATVGDQVKRTVARITESASAASRRESGSVAPQKVSASPTSPPTFEEALAAAKRGQRFE
jgi:hypothetical protein